MVCMHAPGTEVVGQLREGPSGLFVIPDHGATPPSAGPEKPTWPTSKRILALASQEQQVGFGEREHGRASESESTLVRASEGGRGSWGRVCVFAWVGG